MQHTGLGIASFILAIAMGLLMLATFVTAGVLESSTPGGMDEDSTEAMVVGLFMLGTGFGTLVSFILGIAGVCQTDRKRIFAVLGIVFSALILAGTTGLVVLGLLLG